jgi:hypothetical protein
MLSRRHFIAASATVAGAPALPAAAAAPQVLRIAMTAADIPTPTGIPNNGFEGNRVTGAFPRAGASRGQRSLARGGRVHERVNGAMIA